MADLEFAIDEWTGVGHGKPEEIATRALLRVVVGGQCVTRNDSLWSRTVTDRVHVSLYPMALWVVANWWRLGHEPSWSGESPNYDWRASHDLPAAGGGYLWPNLRFQSDGESVVVSSRPTPPTSLQPIRYLDAAEVPIEHRRFEITCARLAETVLARLHDMGLGDTDLKRLWREVQNERADPRTERGRRFEALLHGDPDAIDAEVLEEMERLAAVSGQRAASEVVAGLHASVATEEARGVLEKVRTCAGSKGTWLDDTNSKLGESRAFARDRSLVPWDRGMRAARALRLARNLGDDLVRSPELEGQLAFHGALDADSPDMPFALAVRNDQELQVFLRAKHPVAKRFEFARLLGDLILAPEGDRWHPSTSLYTARQKYQRAFAAEFLCPAAGLRRFLGDDRSEDKILAAADHFEVSPLAVAHQVENHLDAVRT